MAQDSWGIEALSGAARQLVQRVHRAYLSDTSRHMGVHHWLRVILADHADVVAQLMPGADPGALAAKVQEDPGEPLDVPTLLALLAPGADVAQVVAAVLGRAGWRAEREAPGAPAELEDDTAAQDEGEDGDGLLDLADSAPDSPAPPPVWSPRLEADALPVLSQYGRDLTEQAQADRLPPVVGRDEEVALVIETLARETKRNAALVGPAGVGKTAIAEALAQRIVRGEVPEFLQHTRVLALSASSLSAGATYSGELEKRVQALLKEAGQPGVVLFMDEFHTLMGGRTSGSLADMLKPALARGDLACIAATTDDEYRRFIEADSAFERRFQPVRVQEPTPEVALTILKQRRDRLAEREGASVADDVLVWLLDFAVRQMPSRFLPDKAVDLLEQAVAHASTENRGTVTLEDAQAVAQRVVGMPLAPERRLAAVREALQTGGLLEADGIEVLTARLSATLRGLDLKPARPNAALLFLDALAAEAVARTLAHALFSDEARVVTIDVGMLREEEHITQLLGSPPGYVGHGQMLPLHRVAQMPWCVIHFAHVESCHPVIRQALADAFADGHFSLAEGKRVYLSNAIVVMSADIEAAVPERMGFREADGAADGEAQARAVAEAALGDGLVDEVDWVAAGTVSGAETLRAWLAGELLPALCERYRHQRLEVDYDAQLLDWLLKQQPVDPSRRECERMVDHRLVPLLVDHIPPADGEPVAVRLVVCDGRPVVEQGG